VLDTTSHSLQWSDQEGDEEDTSIESSTLVNFLTTHYLSSLSSLIPQSLDIMGLPALVLDTLYTIEVSQGYTRG
jgi:hypothetical protein